MMWSLLLIDQQCTVTRPGLAGIASATAVELLASVISHPLGPLAPANESGVLGQVPHQLRGMLGQFEQLKVVGHAYDKCTACSAHVVDAYHEAGTDFILKALASPKYLEDLTGLSELQNQVDDLELENDLDWDE